MRLASNGMSHQFESRIRPSLQFSFSAWLLAFLATCLVHAPSNSMATDFEHTLQMCVETLAQNEWSSKEVHPINLAESCPGFHSNLNISPLKYILDPPLEQEATLSQLKDLVTFFKAAHHQFDQPFQFDYVGLQDLLSQTLIEEPPRTPSFWELFLQWLREQLQQHDPEEISWLLEFFDWIEQFQWLSEWVIYGIASLIVLIAIFIVGNEIRHSSLGWFKKQSCPSPGYHDPSHPTVPSRLTWEDVLALPPKRQPAAILRWIIASFMHTQHLPHNESLTNKEFIAYLGNLAHPKTGKFGELVTMTEAVVYGERGIDHTTLEKLVQTADGLKDSGTNAVKVHEQKSS